MVSPEVAVAVVVGVVCCVVESSVGVVAVSVDLIVCDLVNRVVDVMF